MPVAISGGSKIRTNIPAENAYNSLLAANNNIALRQLRLSTGKRINAASDDVAGYITSRALAARNSSLKSALNAVGEAKNVTAIAQDALDNIQGLINEIKTSAATASSGALGTDEKVALAKGAYRLAQQIQFITDSTVFGGKQLLQGAYTGDWTVGFYADNTLLELEVNISTDNADYNITGGASNDFNLNATSDALAAVGGVTSNFAGVEGLTLEDLDSISTSDLGIFSEANINTTLQSLSQAIDNVNKVASYIGGIEVRLNSQESLLTSQITNYNAAISRIEDADVATEQLELIKSQFLQQSSLISLAQANQNPQSFLQLFR
ncbi:MAG: flagellin [Desulfobulbaceae bacterium]|nr:flagellin [Ignavibacteria bacterium]MBS4001066.1 flagellin [Desulfobulbaceae bacterium]